MNKKDLSDLIREEAQKAPTSADSANQSEEAKTPAKPRGTRQRKTTSDRSQENKIKALTADLEASEKRANALQQKTDALESELEVQKNLVETLQSKLQQTTQIEAELEDQKKLVEKIFSELEEQKQLVAKLYAELKTVEQQQKVEQQPPPEPSSDLVPQPASKNKIQYRPIRPIASNHSQADLSNDVIGWFD